MLLKNESFVRLLSVGLLGVLFISATAMADKEKVSTNLFSGVEHIEEAERINNNEFHAYNLTAVGERMEIIKPLPIKSAKK